MYRLVMKKVDLLPELVNASRLLLVADVGVLFNNSLVDLLLKVIQIHHHAVLTQGLAELRNKPGAYNVSVRLSEKERERGREMILNCNMEGL